MKKYRSLKIAISLFIVALLITALTAVTTMNKKVIKVSETSLAYNYASESHITSTEHKDANAIVYDGLTMDELAEKIDKNLNSTLSGYGKTFARLSVEYEVDPYIATSIVLLETGCKWNCSSLVRKCNNIGGMKGKNHCGSSAYAAFPTLDDGIEAFFRNLSRGYFKKGLTTSKAINRKYAENPNWYKTVDNYVSQIKSS